MENVFTVSVVGMWIVFGILSAYLKHRFLKSKGWTWEQMQDDYPNYFTKAEILRMKKEDGIMKIIMIVFGPISLFSVIVSNWTYKDE